MKLGKSRQAKQFTPGHSDWCGKAANFFIIDEVWGGRPSGPETLVLALQLTLESSALERKERLPLVIA